MSKSRKQSASRKVDNGEYPIVEETENKIVYSTPNGNVAIDKNFADFVAAFFDETKKSAPSPQGSGSSS